MKLNLSIMNSISFSRELFYQTIASVNEFCDKHKVTQTLLIKETDSDLMETSLIDIDTKVFFFDFNEIINDKKREKIKTFYIKNPKKKIEVQGFIISKVLSLYDTNGIFNKSIASIYNINTIFDNKNKTNIYTKKINIS